MNTPISYDEALKRHPVQVAEIMAKHAKTRGKDKDVDPTHFTWEYSWGISIQGFSFADLLSGKDQEPETRTLEERIGSVTLMATKGRRWAGNETPIKAPLPPEVLAWHNRPPVKTIETPVTLEDLKRHCPNLICVTIRRPEED
jgi:hypothetical protein